MQRGLMPIARRWWPVVVLGGLIAFVTAYVVASRVQPTYEASVTLLTGPINTDFGTLRASGDLARTYAELATSGPVLRFTASELGVERTTESLRASISSSSNDVTRLVRIRVRDEDPELAARIADTLAGRLAVLTAQVPQESISAVESLLRQPEIERLPGPAQERVRAAATRALGQPLEGRLQIVDPAEVPSSPVAPRVPLITILAGLAGLLGAGTLVLLKESFSDAIDSDEDLAAAGAPFLGSIHAERRWLLRRPKPLVVEYAPNSTAAGSYRLLATKLGLFDDETKLGLFDDEQRIRTLLVIGSEQLDGAGLVAANLAAVLAENETQVVLVDANSVDAEITRLLGLDGTPGYTDLIGTADWGAFAAGQMDGFRVLPRGTVARPIPLTVDRAQMILNQLLAPPRRVVLNAPALEKSPSTLVWAQVVDATVVVAKEGRTSRNAVADTVKSLSLVGAKLAGTVLREGGHALRR